MLEIHHVRQKGDWFCFLACMESFLLENGRPRTQEEIRLLTPDIFGANLNDLGAFAANNFPRVEQSLGLTATRTAELTWQPPRQSLFALVKWNGKIESPHWIRVIGQKGDDLLAMNPGTDVFPDVIPLADFAEWVLGCYIVSLN